MLFAIHFIQKMAQRLQSKSSSKKPAQQSMKAESDYPDEKEKGYRRRPPVSVSSQYQEIESKDEFLLSIHSLSLWINHMW